MKNQKAYNFVIREISKLGIGGILRRSTIIALALDKGIPESAMNRIIYKLIDEEVMVIASAGMYAIRATKNEIGVEPDVELPNESSLSTQIGGNHYKSTKIQPVVFIARAKLTFIQGNIVKYAFRAYKKNGVQDIEKCIHYAQIAIELAHHPKMNVTWNKYMNKFIEENELNGYQAEIIRAACFGKWKSVIEASNKLKSIM